jgi:hypothetical protein
VKIGDLVRITHPPMTGDHELILDAWTAAKPVLILKEGSIEYPDGRRDGLVLIQLGKRTSWVPKNNLEVVSEAAKNNG